MPSATIVSTATCNATFARLAVEKKFGVQIASTTLRIASR